ncbi:Lysozyme subfamily 2 [Desulfurobacterium thermolithotrophum DSM 11699]|uniref:Lysozyme subfamily 2 n=1 Tax=Desulfurobacterium thermolithotrophum (strain DSM 11699 / BSA) TaxID=868864 RepID=F0S380_DESTD|nr:glucosaminidase domain-containing protein [Desulfurobacterium thermolithotrophum]ADY73302.1 Lysozyme subfamily 2 [Desulfurobacterium thermolithotrophum DSM 11699]
MRKFFLVAISIVVAFIIPLFFMEEQQLPKEEFPLRKKTGEKRKETIPSIFYIENPTVEEIVPINCSKVVPIVYSHVTCLRNLSIEQRKKKFIDVLLPEVLIANEKVLKERSFLLRTLRKKKLSKKERLELKKLKKKYRTDNIDELLRRVNSVPVSLVLAQGAIESGWGTSRFFIEGNNVFGMYAFYTTNKKLKARNGNVYLKVYDDILQSVEDYIYNLNVGWAYKEFRRAREKGASLSLLVKTLVYYSTKRNNYVDLIRNIIKKNYLTYYDKCFFNTSNKK